MQRPSSRVTVDHKGYSMPCCFFRRSRFSWRSARSSFDLAIFSGWWYNTSGRSVTHASKTRQHVRTNEIAVLEVETT